MTMPDEIVESRAKIFPTEIREAVGAFENDNSQAIIATLLEEGPQSFSQLRDDLGVHQQTLTNSLNSLRDSGLIRKRLADSDEGEYESYYEVSEFGSRFVDCLLNSLGSVDSFQQDPPFRPVDNYQDPETGDEPIVEQYHIKESELDEPTPGQ